VPDLQSRSGEPSVGLHNGAWLSILVRLLLVRFAWPLCLSKSELGFPYLTKGDELEYVVVVTRGLGMVYDTDAMTENQLELSPLYVLEYTPQLNHDWFCKPM
jgi:hypothetical protein